MFFEWDEEKARKNVNKHGVSFDEARSVFDDPLGRIDDDPDHSLAENRELIVGYSRLGRLLLVNFVARGERVRIISARETDRDERRRHEEDS
jgi:uncharacterized DUF497 family protein